MPISADCIRGKPVSAADCKVFYIKLLDLGVLFSDDVGFGAGSDWMSLADKVHTMQIRFGVVVCMVKYSSPSLE